MSAEQTTAQPSPSATRSRAGRAVTTSIVTALRVTLAALWINEAILKWDAGFGRADILLVVALHAQNPRVPEFY